MVGFQMLGPSAFNYLLGSKSRISAAVVVVMSALFLILGLDLLKYIPIPIIGGYLLFIGLTFLYQFLVTSRRNLRSIEYAATVFIFATIALVGILEGIVLGLLVSSIIFIVNYAKISNIKHIGTGHRSNVERSPQQEAILSAAGGQICAIRLQGYLFFGSVYSLYTKIKNYIQKLPNNKPHYVLIDFSNMQGIDSSAVNCFLKIKQLADQNKNLFLLFSQLNSQILAALKQCGILNSSNWKNDFQDLDRALEWCENRILAQSHLTQTTPETIEDVLTDIFSDSIDATAFSQYLRPRQLKSKQILFKAGDASDAIYFLIAGELSVVSEIDVQNWIRHRKIGKGAIVGEMGYYTQSKRSAKVMAAQTSFVLELSAANIKKMEKQLPHVAFKFQNYLIRLLSRRLIQKTDEVNYILS